MLGRFMLGRALHNLESIFGKFYTNRKTAKQTGESCSFSIGTVPEFYRIYIQPFLSLPPRFLVLSIGGEQGPLPKDSPTVETRQTGKANLPAGAFPMHCSLGPRQ